MLAILHDPASASGVRLGDVDEPMPTRSQVLLDVHATSLNFGELAFMAERQPPGHVAGNDAAGVVAQAAADGSGPPAGTRVAASAPQARGPGATSSRPPSS